MFGLLLHMLRVAFTPPRLLLHLFLVVCTLAQHRCARRTPPAPGQRLLSVSARLALVDPMATEPLSVRPVKPPPPKKKTDAVGTFFVAAKICCPQGRSCFVPDTLKKNQNPEPIP